MVPVLGIYAFFVALICAPVRASNLYGGYSKNGCYSNLDGWQSMGSTEQQTAGTCGGQCSDNNFPLFALSGSQCYCGSAYPPSSQQSSSGSCNTPCNFYPSDTCGSQGAFVVYQISGKQASTAAASSSTPTSQASSQSSQDTASQSSAAPSTDSQSSASQSTAAADSTAASSSDTPSTSSASPSSTASSPTTQAATTSQSPTSSSDDTSSQTGQSTSSAQTVTVTASSSTSGASSSPTTQSSSSSQSSSATSSGSSSASSSTSTSAGKLDPKGKDAKSKSGISGGAIAGIVVGVVVGVLVIAALIILLCLRWRHRDREDEYYSPTASPNELKSSIGSFHNPYPERPVVDQRLNPAMLGDPRISIASLADARDYSRQILKVANPDEKSII